MSLLPVQQRVDNGVRLLNEQFGSDWYENIDLGELDLASINYCIIGQLFGGWYPQNLGITKGDGDAQIFYGLEVPGVGHGQICDYDTEREALNEEWSQRIISLRE